MNSKERKQKIKKKILGWYYLGIGFSLFYYIVSGFNYIVLGMTLGMVGFYFILLSGQKCLYNIERGENNSIRFHYLNLLLKKKSIFLQKDDLKELLFDKGMALVVSRIDFREEIFDWHGGIEFAIELKEKFNKIISTDNTENQ